jgi:hypothetical protein
MEHSSSISAPDDLHLPWRADHTLPRGEGQELFDDQLRARDTRSVRRASGLVLARDSGQFMKR